MPCNMWICGLIAWGMLASAAVAQNYTPLDPSLWSDKPRKIVGVDEPLVATIAFPAKQRRALSIETAESLPAGLYRVRMTLRPSHTSDEVAWTGGLEVKCDREPKGQRLAAIHFARVHQSETKTIEVVHRKAGPLALELAAFVDDGAVDRAIARAKIGGKSDDPLATKGADGEDDLVGELTVGLSPTSQFYYLVDSVEIAPASHSALVSEVYCNKVRYVPGETLTGYAMVEPVGKSAAKGKLIVSLEHGLNTRTEIRAIDIAVEGAAKKIEFEIPLPKRELGHAIVATFVSTDGKDRHEAKEYFNIAADYQRVAISGSPYGHGATFNTDYDAISKLFRAHRKNYTNYQEVFAWAEEDMVEMSPQDDVWYSGQTCYRIKKQGMQNWIKAAHEHGWAFSTYGKYVMSGYLGWKTAWDKPNDHRGNFYFPVGMWEAVDVRTIDRFRHKEFVWDTIVKDPINGMWQNFLPINPDVTPAMVRVAAEECIRSVEMFGWDAIRWDGHPHAGGQTNVQGTYDYDAARRTQTLVRYFKDIVDEKYPGFGHGYNYLFIEDDPKHAWAVEDFEMDEICRGGGLIMNESIREGLGKTFEWHARNVQVEGDLCRERGGFYLCIPTDGGSERDMMLQFMIYFAGGCRPYGSSLPVLNRYATRYSCFTLDETLRRLARPEGVIKPVEKTSLWWDPFVLETQAAGGASQLVVNLLNVPRDEVPHSASRNPAPKHVQMQLSPGSDPMKFAVTLPKTHTLKGAHLIDPFTLEVERAVVDGQTVAVPPVSIWRVLVLDLAVADGAQPLAAQFGPPKTLGVERQDPKIKRFAPVVLDIHAPIEDVNKVYFAMPGAEAYKHFDESPALLKLSSAERDAELRKLKTDKGNQPEELMSQWWKGAQLGADLKLKDAPPKSGDVTPIRDGVLDVHYARGAMTHRLRIDEALARLGRFTVQEGWLAGSRLDYRTQGHLSAAGFRDKDLLIYADVPHGAIGVNESYALVDYVKAGGAVLLTGGNYSFGKGGYLHTALDRELLPVECVEMVDTRYSRTPLVMEAAADFAELKLQLDAKQPLAFWVYNQVALRDSKAIKVFLKAGNRPILVGWQLGKGRVACLLATHMGEAEQGAVPYYEAAQWPAVMAAVMKWLTPDAAQTQPKAAAAANEQLAAAIKKLGGAGAEIDQLLDVTGGDDAPSGDNSAPGPQDLEQKLLDERLTLIRLVLAAPSPEASAALAKQLALVGNVPTDVRQKMLQAIQQDPPKSVAELAASGKACLAHRNPEVRGTGYQLLALAGDKAFLEIARTPTSSEEPELHAHRCLGIALFKDPALKKHAEQLVADWSKAEAATKLRYTGTGEWSIAYPQQPCFPAPVLLERVAWLAYLSRLDAPTYATDFSRQWQLLRHYSDYCVLTMNGLWASLRDATRVQSQLVKNEVKTLYELLDTFNRLRSTTRPLMEQLLISHQKQCAEGMVHAAFQVEVEGCIELLGPFAPDKTSVALEILSTAKMPALADFCRARLSGSGRKVSVK